MIIYKIKPLKPHPMQWLEQRTNTLAHSPTLTNHDNMDSKPMTNRYWKPTSIHTTYTNLEDTLFYT
ncbi:hypothetical protein [Candidatus Synchoanobacter obligatus]|uniref:Uncharacterized protein n=1 Tax=Candidatus Synchoanobacter obligatus TaxID=2919597 RepID=A0ABT1L3J8_9GAMM|nr:hypothetical protein [Candidatus Synchoanobacter obligatus]MCP8351789.1 hypothetical protein [Candidatus Synchoanobacter obligatus]